MRKASFLIVVAFCAGPGIAAGSTHCDATPFSLGRAPEAASKPQRARPPTTSVPSPKRVDKPRPKPQARLIAPCTDKKKAEGKG
jgi:hypothetical protein